VTCSIRAFTVGRREDALELLRAGHIDVATSGGVARRRGLKTQPLTGRGVNPAAR